MIEILKKRRNRYFLFRKYIFCFLLGCGGLFFISTNYVFAYSFFHRKEIEKNPVDPDELLIAVYKDLAANHLREAELKADALVAAYPNFRLGHLVRGDLLLLRFQRITNLGAVNGPADKLASLRQEALVRLNALRERPRSNMLPRSILQLREDQKYALLVDAKRSRLYVYENKQGQLKLVTDYYISQGKLGANKLKEGDQKTPLGVYYITGRLAGDRLPDYYGAGALIINYPNDWDRINGRSGSGIWLHGTPSDSFSRPPLASDGCVVLTNPDLYKLYASVKIGTTPVVISNHVEFIEKNQWESERNNIEALLEKWRQDIESKDAHKLLSNYSTNFKSHNGEDLSIWFTKNQQTLPNVSIKLRNVTIFLYPNPTDLMLVSFTQDTLIGKSRHSKRKRQYWAKESGSWKIVSETHL